MDVSRGALLPGRRSISSIPALPYPSSSSSTLLRYCCSYLLAWPSCSCRPTASSYPSFSFSLPSFHLIYGVASSCCSWWCWYVPSPSSILFQRQRRDSRAPPRARRRRNRSLPWFTETRLIVVIVVACSKGILVKKAPGDPCMDGKELISPSDLPPFYPQQHHRMLGGGGGGHSSSPSSLAGMHSVIRPMPNMSMSPTAILQSIGGAGSHLSGMQFHHMDGPPSPASSMMHGGNMGSVSGSGNTIVSVSGSGGGTMPATSPPEPVKRKRGRPRKYGPDGAMKQHHHMPSPSQAQRQHQMMGAAPPRMGSMSGQDMAGGLDDAAAKKRRGRPPGTGKKLSSPKPSGNAFSGSAGTSFTPHIITASPSEDVAGKIAAFASQSPRAVCVLSAMGSVSRAVLRHQADHATSVSMAPSYNNNNNPSIYEGLYEILSLSGSYNLTEAQQNQSDGLSVTLCSPERHVIGGVLGGALVAASTVQVVLGTFVNGGSKSKPKKAAKPPPAFGPDSLTGGGPDVSPGSGGHNQTLAPPPPSVVTTGGWPSSGIFDTRSSSIDINSSRG